mmetsp:Transcript_8413/g.27156  ORF Transcript_8413/g.27156 Transcript_8413/m.27156 type:complete len:221 (+) Transcript_8413:907-1569(+)
MGWPPRRADARCGRRGAVAARAPHRVGRHERRASRALRDDRRRVPLAHGARLQRLRLHRAARRRPRRPRRPPLPARKLPLARGCRQRARVRAHRQRHRRGHRRRLSGRPPRQPLVRHGRLELGRVLAGSARPRQLPLHPDRGELHAVQRAQDLAPPDAVARRGGRGGLLRACAVERDPRQPEARRRRAHELHLHAAARRRGAQGVGQVGLRLPLLLGDAV